MMPEFFNSVSALFGFNFVLCNGFAFAANFHTPGRPPTWQAECRHVSAKEFLCASHGLIFSVVISFLRWRFAVGIESFLGEDADAIEIVDR